MELPGLVYKRPEPLNAERRVLAERRYWHLSAWSCSVMAVSGQSNLLQNPLQFDLDNSQRETITPVTV